MDRKANNPERNKLKIAFYVEQRKNNVRKQSFVVLVVESSGVEKEVKQKESFGDIGRHLKASPTKILSLSGRKAYLNTDLLRESAYLTIRSKVAVKVLSLKLLLLRQYQVTRLQTLKKDDHFTQPL